MQSRRSCGAVDVTQTAKILSVFQFFFCFSSFLSPLLSSPVHHKAVIKAQQDSYLFNWENQMRTDAQQKELYKCLGVSCTLVVFKVNTSTAIHPVANRSVLSLLCSLPSLLHVVGWSYFNREKISSHHCHWETKVDWRQKLSKDCILLTVNIISWHTNRMAVCGYVESSSTTLVIRLPNSSCKSFNRV